MLIPYCIRSRLQSLENKLTHLHELQQSNSAVLDRLSRDYLPALTYESFDLRLLARLEAGLDSARFFNQHLFDKHIAETDLDLLRHCTALAPTSGLILEFGVFSARTINCISESLPDRTVFGFDSFEGLPETWRSEFTKGTFERNTLPDVGPNVTLIKGWFDTTLPHFLESHSQTVAFLHIDCDLYSSTKTVLNNLARRLANNSIIVFDEFFNYPGWQNHEYKAFCEFISQYHLNYEFIASNPTHQQVAVRIIE
jgi:hypothetical protein